jgi:hypothetical protein
MITEGARSMKKPWKGTDPGLGGKKIDFLNILIKILKDKR